jgi:glycosyltransferase involved in cell wall biosynthesis
MPLPQFSIAVPVRNGASFLREALDSALAQTYAPIEIVISDNASTDDTPLICAEFINRSPCIRYSRSEELLPLGDNWNRACRMASGEWVKLLAHDDLLEQNCLLRIAQELTSLPTDWAGSLALVGTGEQWLFSEDILYSAPRVPPGSAALRFDAPTYVRSWARHDSNVPLPAMVTATIRRSVFDSTGFSNRYYHCDTFFYLRLCCRHHYLYIPDQLAVTRIQPQSVTCTLAKGARPVLEHREFIRELLCSEAHMLNLGPFSRFRLRLKPCAVAATQIAVDGVLGGRIRPAWEAASAVAPWQLPFLPPLVVRAWRRERLRQRRSGLPSAIFFGQAETGQP